jgi:hypothetical protein
MTYRCSTCLQIKEQNDFYPRHVEGVSRPVTYDCIPCIQGKYYEKKNMNPMGECERCQLHRPLFSNQLCRKCMKEKGLRLCKSCLSIQPIYISFERAKAVCNACASKDSHLSAENKLFHAKLMRTYGISLEQYQALATKQGGRCAICKTATKRLVVDHDHKSNQVRGLLCAQCNVGLGMFKDSPAILSHAIAFLDITKSAKPHTEEAPAVVEPTALVERLSYEKAILADKLEHLQTVLIGKDKLLLGYQKIGIHVDHLRAVLLAFCRMAQARKITAPDAVERTVAELLSKLTKVEGLDNHARS